MKLPNETAQNFRNRHNQKDLTTLHDPTNHPIPIALPVRPIRQNRLGTVYCGRKLYSADHRFHAFVYGTQFIHLLQHITGLTL